MPNNQKLPTFEVDKQGLAKILERRGKAFVITELWQNAVDEDNVTRIVIDLKRIGKYHAQLSVADDAPLGFTDLKHAYTLFAESYKKGNALKRGRFDLGEKLVIALCNYAHIITTKGTVVFENGGRRHSAVTTDGGTEFVGRLPMTEEEYEACCREIRRLIVPMNVTTIFNGEELTRRVCLASFPARLLTEIADESGVLRRTPRDTTVELYLPRPSEKATIYEMGVPIVESGDQYHVNILQRVPLNMDRDNVTPGYLRDIRALALNNASDFMTAEEIKAPWVDDALEDDLTETEALKTVVTKRYGEDAVVYDLSDPEANKIAVSQGRQVIHGGSFSRTAWSKIRETEVVRPAGKVTPSAKAWSGEGQADAEPFTDWIPEEKWTTGMQEIARLGRYLGQALFKIDIAVQFCSSVDMLASAAYGNRCLSFNKLRLGGDWFEQDPLSEPVLALLIHELAHELSHDHLSKEYHHALCSLGARIAGLALDRRLLQAMKGHL